MEDNSNITLSSEIYNHENSTESQDALTGFIMHVATCIIISIGLPLTLVTIYALYFLIRKDHVAPIYVINLLITDLFQLCCMIVFEAQPNNHENDSANMIAFFIYSCLLPTSVCFMVCVSLERYLVIVHPLWYRFKRNIKISVVVCVVVWVIPPVFYITVFPLVASAVKQVTQLIFLIIPFPLFIFFLVETLRVLSVSVSVSSEEKRRIVGILVLVLLIYTLLFMPCIIYFSVKGSAFNYSLSAVSFLFLKLSPLADVALYLFIRKDTVSKSLAAACCCKSKSDTNREPTVNTGDL